MKDAYSSPIEVPHTLDRKLTDNEWLLADTLLRRGYPVRYEPRGLVLLPGALSEDQRDRREFRRFLPQISARGIEAETPVETIEVWHGDTHFGAADLVDTRPLDRRRNRSLGRESISGLTAAPVSGNFLDWNGFLATSYGANFQVRFLEEGVALLVKVLPWCGVLTSMSCHGHPGEGDRRKVVPTIWFYGHYHSRWCEMIFDRMAGDLPISATWVFDHGPVEGGWKSATWEISSSATGTQMERQFQFDQIQRMARRFFDEELCRRIRGAKSKSSDLDDLAVRLDAVFASR